MLLSLRVIISGLLSLICWTSGFSQDVDISKSDNLINLFKSLGDESYEVRQKTQNLILDQGKKNKDLVLEESFNFYIKTEDPEVKYAKLSRSVQIMREGASTQNTQAFELFKTLTKMEAARHHHHIHGTAG